MTTTLDTREQDIAQARLDILDGYAALGWLLSNPAINQDAELRRQWSITVCQREIARLERNLLELRQDEFPIVDLTLRCPSCGARADMCFDHGDDWKKRPLPPVHEQTEAQLRAGVNDFTEDDPPPYPLSPLASRRAPGVDDPADGYPLGDPKRSAFESRHW